MFDLPCVIFAGGKSSRMGKDKALLPFGGVSSLALYQYNRLKPLFKTLYISSKTDKFDFDTPVILDQNSDIFAPTIALKSIFEKLDDEAFFVLSVDTPFVDEDVISSLVDAYSTKKYDAVIAHTVKGAQPLCGIYSKSILPKLNKQIKKSNHRLTQLLKMSDTLYVDFDKEDRFFNINCPDEYALANQNTT